MGNVTKWKSTILGLVALVIPVLVAVGWIAPDKAGPLGENAGTLIEAIFALVAAVFGFIGVFKLNDDG